MLRLNSSLLCTNSSRNSLQRKLRMGRRPQTQPKQKLSTRSIPKMSHIRLEDSSEASLVPGKVAGLDSLLLSPRYAELPMPPILCAESRCIKLLSRLATVTCGQILKIVLDASKTQGSMTGQEERDNLFARLFGITSIIHSGLIARNGTLPTSSTSASSPESYKLVLSALVALGEKKSWLREGAWWALTAGVEALVKSDVEWKEQGLEATFDIIYAKVSGWTPEKLALTLRMQTIFPERDWGLVLSPVFKGTDILATQNFKVIANILKVCSGALLCHTAGSVLYRNLGPQRKTTSQTPLQEHGNLSYTSSGLHSLLCYYLRTKTPPLRDSYKIFGV